MGHWEKCYWVKSSFFPWIFDEFCLVVISKEKTSTFRSHLYQISKILLFFLKQKIAEDIQCAGLTG